MCYITYKGIVVPGKSYRKGISLKQFFDMFPDDAAAERWFTQNRWPDEMACPRCGSLKIAPAKHPRMPYRCRDCKKYFSARTGTPLENSRLGFQTWLLAMYLMNTGIKGTSSMKLHRDLNVTQKTAWFLAHRLREAWSDQEFPPFKGPVEVDEAYMGGKKKWMHNKDKGKSVDVMLMGIKDRATNKISTAIVEKENHKAMRHFVYDHAKWNAYIYTDGHTAYKAFQPSLHYYVLHSRGQYVSADVWTNGMESHWAMLKRGYVGTYHKMSPEHLQRYANEFSGRHNDRTLDTEEQMVKMIRMMEGKTLSYASLIAEGPRAQAVRRSQQRDVESS